MIFSQRLKGLLSETKTTWKEVSMTLDIDKNQQKYWEDKDIAPDGKTLCKLCEYFHVTSDYLLGLSDSKTPGMSANPTIHGNLVIHTFVCPQIKRYQRF